MNARRRSWAIPIIALTLALAGCSGGSGNSTTGDTGSSTVKSGAAATAPSESFVVPNPAAGTAGGVVDKAVSTAVIPPVDLSGQQLARSASITLTVDDIRGRAAQVRAAATTSGGLVLQENVTTEPSPTPTVVTDPASGEPTKDQPAYAPAVSAATLVLQVPSDRLDATMTTLASLGTVTSRAAQAEDVTTARIDAAARIETLKESVARVRALMAKAATLDQVVALEREVTTRQAELESMQAQLTALDKRVATSTITVSLLPAATPTAVARDGFLGGLLKSWDALVTGLAWSLGALGAALPFLVLVGLIAVPLWRYRVRRHRGPTRATPQPATQASEN